MVVQTERMQSIADELAAILEKLDRLELDVAAAHVQAGLDAVRDMTDIQLIQPPDNNPASGH